MVDLRNFLANLEKKEDLIRIKEPLSVRYEIPSILKYFEEKKAVMIECVKEHEHQVVGGVCGTRDRIIDAIGVESNDLYKTLKNAASNPLNCEIGDGPVKEVVNDEACLGDFPVLTHYEGDPGPYITAGIVYAKSVDGSEENVSFHRLLLLDDKRMGIRVVPRQLYRINQIARKKGAKSIDVSISIGVHPAVYVAAAYPAPFGTSEFGMANALMGGNLKLVECPHVNALAPADAEIVLEGRLRLDETVTEGPFVDLSGTYDVPRQQPVVELVGVFHREDYIYEAILPAGSEHRLLMGLGREVRISEYVNNVVPTVKGVNMTLGGMGWLHCVVSFEKFREGDPKNVLLAIFAAHPSLKHAVVVDSDINPYDMKEVEWAIATRFRGDEDILIIPHVRVSSLDPVSDQNKELGCKVGIDATKPLGLDGFEKPEIPESDNIKKILERYFKPDNFT